MEHLLRAALMNALTASALAALVAGFSLIFSRRPAAVHCLWLIVLAKLVSPPLFEAPLGLFTMQSELVRSPVVAESEPPPLGVDLEPIAEMAEFPALESLSAVTEEPKEHIFTPAQWAFPWRALGLIWLAGVVVSASFAMARIVRFQRLLNDAKPAGSGVDAEIAKLADRMDLKRRPRAVMVEGRLAPMLWAVGHDPRLVLPRALWEGLTARQRTLLLTHELAHWKRGDHRVRYFELVVTVLYWWLPVVWWVRRALRDAEEQCCDAWVVWMFPNEARTYAETLLDALDFLNPATASEPLLASGFGKAAHLRRRLVMVMKGTTPRSLGWTGTLGALALAGVLLPIGPIWGQKGDVAPVESEPVEAAADDGANGVRVQEKLDGITDADEDTGAITSYQFTMYRPADEVDREQDMMEMAMRLRTRAGSLMEREDATRLAKSNAKALLSAAAEFERLAKTTEEGTFPFEGGKIIIQRATPGSGDAQIIYTSRESEGAKMARGKVEKLRRELDDQQKRLMQTQRKLAEATGKLDALQNDARRASGLGPDVKSPVRSLTPPSPAAKARERRVQLESRLSEILEELASLKKERAEVGDQN